MKISCFIENDNTKNYLVYKSPVKDILNNSVLVVSESEEALFVRDGVIVNKFTAGRYQLTTNKYPLLISIQKKFLDDVSSVSVYFIRKTDNINLEWGTDSPIQMVDYKYNFTVNIGAFGVYSFKIDNSQKTLVKLIGLDSHSVSVSNFDVKFKSVFISYIKTEIATYMKENKLSVMDVNTEYFNIAKSISKKLQVICEEYGIKLIDFTINSISIPKDDPYYAMINEAIVQQRIFEMQGSAYDHIANREAKLHVAKNSNLQTAIGLNLNQDQTNSSIRCPSCGENVLQDMAFCPKCGNKIQTVNFCTNCGTKIEQGMKFCYKCGKEM